MIRNLNNGGEDERRTGLFGVIDKAVVKNLRIENAQINTTGEYTRLHTGVLASWANASAIENCSTSGTLTCATDILIGGLVGQATAGTRIVGCGSDVDVKSTFPPQEVGGPAPTVGGLVGQWETVAENSLIADCYFAGSLDVASSQAACGGKMCIRDSYTIPQIIKVFELLQVHLQCAGARLFQHVQRQHKRWGFIQPQLHSCLLYTSVPRRRKGWASPRPA